MEGLRKKRKMMNNNEDDEDVKMETFFALLRNVKDIRDRLLGLQGSSDRGKTTTTTTTTMKGTRVVETGVEKDRIDSKIWQPSFKPEDFGVVNTRSSGGVGGGNCTSGNNKQSNEEDDDHEDDGDNNNIKDRSKDNTRIVLDLNLSL